MNKSEYEEMFKSGDRVFIREGHPWAGEFATVLGFEYITILRQKGQWEMKVKLNNGIECYISEDKHVQLLPPMLVETAPIKEED